MAPSRLAPRGPGQVAAGTPADRDRFLDALRAGSILLVVAGHWLIAAVVRRGGVLRADNALASITWMRPLTWAFQLMPVFFMVAGFASARALARRPAPAAALWRARTRRVMPPTLVLAGAWLVLAAVLLWVGVDAATVHEAAGIAAQPLWFLAVYLLLVAVAPAQYAVHRRHPWAAVVALPAVAGGLDALRLSGLAPGVAVGNYLAVFMFAQELGFWYADGRLRRVPARRLLAVAAGALAVLVALTVPGPYPVSMVGVPGEDVSNMSPPTVCILVLTVAQVGVLLALRPAIERGLRRPAAWRATVAVNLVVLTVFLWHLTAFVAATAVLTAAGVGLHPVGTGGWWLTKGLWVLVAMVVLAVLVRAGGGLERTAKAAPVGPAYRWLPLAGTLLAAVGLAGLAAAGFTHPFTVTGRSIAGLRFSPALGMAMVVAGWLLATTPRRRRPPSDPSGPASPLAARPRRAPLRTRHRGLP